jgi:multicomponent Na+:H+ antiporter subunit B
MLKNHKILKLATNFIFPFIVLFALFIQVNGEASPGGGFQAGAIFASGIVAIDIIFGREKFNNFFSSNYLLKISALGVAIYAITGFICLSLGANFLDYNVLYTLKPTIGQSLGIFTIELGVGLCVASTLTLIYFEFSKL